MDARFHRIGFILIFLCSGLGPAAAEEIVVESYGGERPADADALLRPIQSELRTRGYLVGDALAGRIELRHSRPGEGVSADEVARARRFVDSGYDQFLDGNWDLTIEETERGLSILQSAPAHMARNQETRDLLFGGLVHMAGAYHNLGEAEKATRTMAELIRTFPDREISRAKYAPNIWSLWRQVRDDLDEQGRGTLLINVDDSRTVVFVQERYTGLGNITLDDLPSGRHRVYVQQGERTGRVHEIEVDAGGEAVLSITWALDAALRTTGGYVGLEHPSEERRAEDEARLAVKLARATGTSGVTVLGIREVNGRRSIVGTVLSLDTGKPIRSAALAVEPVEPSAEKIRALGRFLAGEEVRDDMFEDLSPGDGPTGPRDDGSDRLAGGARPFKTWKWVALVGGVGAMAGGGVLIAIHEPKDESMLQESYRESLVPGIFTAGAGAILTGIGVYMWARDRDDARETRLSVTPSGDGVSFAISGRF